MSTFDEEIFSDLDITPDLVVYAPDERLVSSLHLTGGPEFDFRSIQTLTVGVDLSPGLVPAYGSIIYSDLELTPGVVGNATMQVLSAADMAFTRTLLAGASVALSKGANPVAVRVMFGWSSMETVNNYAVVGDRKSVV